LENSSLLIFLLCRDSLLSIGSRDLITVSPATFFTKSILNSSSAIATSIAKQFPEIWSPPKSRYPVYKSDSGLDVEFAPGFFALDWGIKRVLCSGSYEQVQFVLKGILPLRSLHTARKFKKSAKAGKCHTQEDGIPEWTRCPLSHQEYTHLLSGTIGVFRPDREALWNVIQEQITLGHSTSMYYLRYAIMSGDTNALEQMLSRGWCANGPFWAYFMPPLQFCQQVLESYSKYSENLFLLTNKVGELARFLNPDLPQDDWISSSTHKTVYSEYKKQRDDRDRIEWESRHKKCQEIIRKHGGKISPLVTLLRKASVTTKAWALIVYILLYTVVIPLSVVYATNGTWTSMSTGQKFGFIYLWAPLAALLSPILFFGDDGDVSAASGAKLAWFGWWLLIFAVNNFVLPVLIIVVNWRPFQGCKSFIQDGTISTKCTDYSFLLPLAFAAVELLLSYVSYFCT
jgi:hypothetical protein